MELFLLCVGLALSHSVPLKQLFVILLQALYLCPVQEKWARDSEGRQDDTARHSCVGTDGSAMAAGVLVSFGWDWWQRQLRGVFETLLQKLLESWRFESEHASPQLWMGQDGMGKGGIGTGYTLRREQASTVQN